MLIPLIEKNPDLDDFTCRDGEIDWVMESGHADRWPVGPVASTVCGTGNDTASLAPEGALTGCAYGAAVRMTALHNADARLDGAAVRMTALHNLTAVKTTGSHNIRIPLEAGDKPKAELMLGGEVSRVDPATAERLTLAIVQKAAEVLLDLSTDLRRQGLFILPFRYYTMLQTPDGLLSYPSPQGVALPTDFPPHPEITAASVTDDALTLSLRFPVKAYRLTVSPPTDLPDGYSLRTFISYPLYIPDSKEMRGSIGSVRSATGGQATGIRFAFLSTSAIKASVAAPEKYYEMVGNERTGYRLSSKAAAAPDYSCYASVYGYVPPFPRSTLLALGEDVAADTDPMDWIADWVEAECVGVYGGTASQPSEETAEGYLPASLPHKFRHPDGSDPSGSGSPVWPAGIDGEAVMAEASSLGATRLLLTRPMCFAADSVSRRNAEPRSIRTIQVLGLPPDQVAHAILYGSDDGVRWTPLRRFDPRVRTSVLTPPRLFWRLLLMEGGHPDRYAVDVVTSTVYGERSF